MITKSESNREYYLAHRDEIIARQKAYVLEHKEERRAYLVKAKDKIAASTKRYRANHVEERRVYARQRYAGNIPHKLANNLRARLKDAIKGKYRSGSAVRDLGCSIQELRSYLESRFTSGMSWENYGYYGWHIDHIKPLCRFDLTKREEFLEAFHYTNLQPLWAKDNLSKSKK